MQDISNKTLALLLVVAIIVSLGGALMSINRLGKNPLGTSGITGLAVDLNSNATVTLQIVQVVAVNWTTEIVDWNAGAVDANSSACWVDSSGSTGDDVDTYDPFVTEVGSCSTDGFAQVTTGLILENIGNKNVTLNISCGKNADTFIGGTGPYYMYNVSDATTSAEPGSCSLDSEFSFYNSSNAEMTGADRGNSDKAGQLFVNCSVGVTADVGRGVCNSTAGGFVADNYADTLRFDVAVRIPSDAPPGTKTDTITAIIEAIP